MRIWAGAVAIGRKLGNTDKSRRRNTNRNRSRNTERPRTGKAGVEMQIGVEKDIQIEIGVEIQRTLF